MSGKTGRTATDSSGCPTVDRITPGGSGPFVPIAIERYITEQTENKRTDGFSKTC